MFGAFARYGVATVGIPKPGIKFPMHLMTALFIGGYTCEYLALGRECIKSQLLATSPPKPNGLFHNSLRFYNFLEYHVAHDQAEIAAAKACYAKHGGGGGHH
jgi:hypothetical protein